MSKKLLIVESPAKAKTIQKFLGDDFVIASSYGHIRDLPSKNISIDIENGFAPKYVITDDKKDVVKQLQKLAKKAEEIYLATDEDREGEAISWHLCEVLGLDPADAKRVTYTEITKEAIQRALDNPRRINLGLVDAQQARRVLDRIVGYELSPVLWRKVKPSLSAGRVQSVAVRLIVERERAVNAHEPAISFKVAARFDVDGEAVLKAKGGKSFGSEEEARDFLEASAQSIFTISDIVTRPTKRRPSAPFTTSTLQQEASRKLGFSVSRTMSVAQRLYESGSITYMRTDSTNLADSAIRQAAAVIGESYGSDYVKTRNFSTKSSGAQEAHEAIRPTNFNNATAGDNADQERLYDLIWKRAIASQMSDAQLEKTTVTIDVSEAEADLKATGEVMKFDGFLKVYMEGTDDEDDESDDSGILPPLETGQALGLLDMEAVQRFSRPPARFTEASLVKKLEELGIGRPSTYAPTISTIQKRNYVVKESRDGTPRDYLRLSVTPDGVRTETLTETTGAEKMKLFPTDIGILVNDFLVEHFSRVLDYDFTANMEKRFDEVASGAHEWPEVVGTFYDPFHDNIETTLEHADRVTGERVLGEDPKTGDEVLVRMGKYGPMAQIGRPDDETGKKPRYASLLPGQSLQTITYDEAMLLFRLPRELGEWEDQMIKANIGRYGPYVQWGKTFASIPDDQDVYTIELEPAIELIKEKRERDANKYIHVWDDEGIQVLRGRYGPYIKTGKRNVKIPKDVTPEDLTLDEVKEIIANAPAKKRRSRKRK